MYGKATSKKHKTWDSDGLLEVVGKSAILKVTIASTANLKLEDFYNAFDVIGSG